MSDKDRRELTREEMERRIREVVNIGRIPEPREIEVVANLSRRFNKKEREARAKIGRKLIERIDGMNYEELSEKDTALARYYRYNIATSFIGMSLDEFLPADPVHREDELVYMDAGARLAALEYMQD